MSVYTQLTCNITGKVCNISISPDATSNDSSPEGFTNNCTMSIVDGETHECRTDLPVQLDSETNTLLTRAGVTLFVQS
jgi:hypothetical protein